MLGMNTNLARSILLDRMKGVGPDAKLLFLRFALENEDRGLQATVRQLAAAYDLPINVVTEAAAELEQAGYWTRIAVFGDRGRPSCEYKVEPKAWTRLTERREAQDSASRIWPYLDRLNRNYPGARGLEEVEGAKGKGVRSKPPSRRGEGRRLSNPNRLLLMVFLALADDLGVVRGQGAADLAVLTGLTKGRIQTQIEKLVRLQYIRAVVPGVSGRRLFGKVPGAYVLNLHHRSYDRKEQMGGAIFLLEAAPPCVREGAALVGAAREDRPFRVRTCRWSALPEHSLAMGEDVIRELADLIDSPNSGGMPGYLQFMIETYASRLLSRHWGQLCAGPGHTNSAVYTDIQLVNEVVGHLVPMKIKKSDPGRSVPPSDYLKLGGLMYRISVRLAEMIKFTLIRTRLPAVFGHLPSSYQEMDFLLLPATETLGARYFSVIVMPKDPNAMVGRTYVGRIEYGRLRNHVWGDDGVDLDAYSHEEFSQWGLITISRK